MTSVDLDIDWVRLPEYCPKCNCCSVWESQQEVFVGEEKKAAVLENIWNLSPEDWCEEYREKAKTAMKFFQTPLGQRVWCFCDNCGYHQKKNFLWRLKNLFKRN